MRLEGDSVREDVPLFSSFKRVRDKKKGLELSLGGELRKAGFKGGDIVEISVYPGLIVISKVEVIDNMKSEKEEVRE